MRLRKQLTECWEAREKMHAELQDTLQLLSNEEKRFVETKRRLLSEEQQLLESKRRLMQQSERYNSRGTAAIQPKEPTLSEMKEATKKTAAGWLHYDSPSSPK